jgi:predicted anti-sigma-YlaC factor YlaD
MSRSAAYVCRNFVEDVTAYLEGSLSSEMRALVDAHLADCPHCRAYLDQMRRTVDVVGRLGDDDIDEMPDDVRDRLMRAFLEPRD